MLIVVVGILVLALASYSFYSFLFPTETASKINQSHGKIIKNAESESGRDTSSTGGSTSEKSSRNSNKPIGVAASIGKDIIGNTGGDGDDEEPSETDNDGDKREKLKNKNKHDGSSTQGDSNSEEESGDETTGQISGDQWGQNAPNIGSVKKRSL